MAFKDPDQMALFPCTEDIGLIAPDMTESCNQPIDCAQCMRCEEHCECEEYGHGV